MNASVYQAIAEEYRALREQDAREERRRLAQVQEQDAALAALIQARHQMILNATRSVFNEVEPGDLENKMLDYNKKIREALVKAGFPADYLAPVRTCALCDDTGYVGDTVKTPCECMKRRIAEKTDSVSDKRQTFENFDEAVFPAAKAENMQVGQRELMRVMRVFCERYANDFPNQTPRDLLLYGSSGLGKTYLLSCIAQRVRERGHEALCVTAFGALTSLKNAFYTRSGEADQLFSAELLLIDDLGMEPMMENITVEQIYNLLNERRRAGLATVISTNLKMLELKTRYTERVSSRLMDTSSCRILQLMGQDVRLLKKQ